MSYPKLIKCQICGRYPRKSNVGGEYKYSCHISCRNEVGCAGYWHHTKAAAIRAWNKRAQGGWENYA